MEPMQIMDALLIVALVLEVLAAVTLLAVMGTVLYEWWGDICQRRR